MEQLFRLLTQLFFSSKQRKAFTSGIPDNLIRVTIKPKPTKYIQYLKR